MVEGRHLSNPLRYATEKISLEQVVLHVAQYVREVLPNQVAIWDFTSF